MALAFYLSRSIGSRLTCALNVITFTGQYCLGWSAATDRWQPFSTGGFRPEAAIRDRL